MIKTEVGVEKKIRGLEDEKDGWMDDWMTKQGRLDGWMIKTEVGGRRKIKEERTWERLSLRYLSVFCLFSIVVTTLCN